MKKNFEFEEITIEQTGTENLAKTLNSQFAKIAKFLVEREFAIMKRLNIIEGDIKKIKFDISSIKLDVNRIKNDLNSIKLNVNSIKEDVAYSKEGVDYLADVIIQLIDRNDSNTNLLLSELRALNKGVKF